MRFRLHQYAAIIDKENTFLMIQLHLDDRSVKDSWNPNRELAGISFKVVLSGATCSQFSLNDAVLKHLTNCQNCEFIKGGLYKGNLQITAQKEELLLQNYWTAQEIVPTAHLPLWDWDDTDEWGLQNPLESCSIDVCSTERQVLSIIRSVFDPLGMLLPFTTEARIFMQDLWQRHLVWDEVMPCDLLTDWKCLFNNLA